MSNDFGFRCPGCGDADRIDIEACVWVRATGDRTDAALSHSAGHRFTPDSAARPGGSFGSPPETWAEELEKTVKGGGHRMATAG